MNDREKIKVLEERVNHLEKYRFHVSEIPIGEYLVKEPLNAFFVDAEPFYRWVPFCTRDVVEVCPEGAIKLKRSYNSEGFWLRKDEFFYYSCVYTEIKKRIEEKMKKDKSK